MIEAEGLSRRFGAFQAVADVSLQVPAGGVLALLGPNGAGKTTTVRMLAGLLAPSAGRASVAGYDVVRQAAQVRERVGLVTDVPGLYERMTLPDYLDFFGALYGLSRERRAKRIDELLEFFELSSYRRGRMGGFSKGMKQKVALARALLHEPSALFLDEPTSGLDPLSARNVRTLFGDLKRSQRAIILCTHDLDEAERLADQIAIMRRGRIVALGTAATLRQRASPETLVRVELAHPTPGVLEEVRAITGVRDPRQTSVTSDHNGHDAAAPPRLEYRTTAPESVNPIVLARLVELGAAVISATNLTRTLEDVYADTMGLSRNGAEMGPDMTLNSHGPNAAMNGRRTDGGANAAETQRADGGVNAAETVHGSGRTPVVYDRERADAATRAETPQNKPE